MILVTGGTGLVGSHLLFRLLNDGMSVKAIHRKNSNLLQVKKIFSYYTDDATALFEKIHWVEADINDIPALEIAFEDITHVYHCAALISFDPADYIKLRRINIKGTANVVNLCLAKGVQKLCYVSSIATIGKTLGPKHATEENEWNDAQITVYALSKYAAEMEVWRASQEGLSVVIVNPGIIVGPGFWNTGSGVLFKTAARARNYYPPGGTGFVAVEDLVKMMVGLMRSDITKERFIAVSENYTFKEILSKITKILKLPEPKKQLKFWQLEILYRLDWVRNMLLKKGRKLTKVTVQNLRNQETYSNEKIINRLGFKFEPMEKTLVFCCNQFRDNMK